MVALIVSYFVVAYLLIPAAIFRASSIFIPLKKFQRSRAEEIAFAVWISLNLDVEAISPDASSRSIASLAAVRLSNFDSIVWVIFPLPASDRG